MKYPLLVDRKSRLPRLWSNVELKRFARLYQGDIVNVSGWLDQDKEGFHYSDYFENKASYTITNFEEGARGFQGKEGEIFLDLTKHLPEELVGQFDVVFNHTVLEHIFEVEQAFDNLCLMSKDTVILVVPFLQPMHADYGDFWRFTPLCLQKMFEKRNMKVLYSSHNRHLDAGVYIFCIASKQPEKWGITDPLMSKDGTVDFYVKPVFEDGFPHMVGTNGILNILGFIGFNVSKFKKFVKGYINHSKAKLEQQKAKVKN